MAAMLALAETAPRSRAGCRRVVRLFATGVPRERLRAHPPNLIRVMPAKGEL
jgi:hypothetical protein